MIKPFILASALALQTVAAEPTADTLTQQDCAALATAAYHIALTRDAGLDNLIAHEEGRLLMERDDPLNRDWDGTVGDLVMIAYDNPQVHPADLSVDLYAGCMQ